MILSPLEDLAGICGAETPDQLWRHLVVHFTLRAELNDFEAIGAFERLHRSDSSDAARTAGLLSTDLRWRRVATSLIGHIAETAILIEAELDEMAEGFLWFDRYEWPVPPSWVTDATVTWRGPASRSLPPVLVVERQIPPPLRRWAAARLARSQEGILEILARIPSLDSNGRDATMVGILDACSDFPAEARGVIVELGASWPSGRVRFRALQLLAIWDPEGAAGLASTDPSATVRAKSARLIPRLCIPSSGLDSNVAGADATVGPSGATSSDQLALFG